MAILTNQKKSQKKKSSRRFISIMMVLVRLFFLITVKMTKWFLVWLIFLLGWSLNEALKNGQIIKLGYWITYAVRFFS